MVHKIPKQFYILSLFAAWRVGDGALFPASLRLILKFEAHIPTATRHRPVLF